MALGKRWGLNRSRLLYYLYHRFICLDPHELKLPNRDVTLKMDGQRFRVANPSKSVIGRAIFLTGVWEPDSTRFVGDRVQEGMTVADIGAHTGYYTMLFARLVGRGGRVLSFEPEDRGLAFLRENIRLNRYANTTVVPIAMSNRVAPVTEWKQGYFPAGDLRVHEDDGSTASTFTRTFDDVAEELEIDRLDLVKIDVEGSELHVLEGMQRSLNNWNPVILLEVHPGKLEQANRREAELKQFLSDQGYRWEMLTEPSSSGVYTIWCEPIS